MKKINQNILIIIGLTILLIILFFVYSDFQKGPSCQDEKLLGQTCATVTPGYNDECCRRQNKDNIDPIGCPGTWIFDSKQNGCKFVCLSEIFPECNSTTQCENGTCTKIGMYSFCVDDPCSLLCTDGQECVIMESYPIQIRCE